MGYILEFRDGPAASVFAMRPETALDFFKAKGLAPTFSYADMVAQEHDVAFTVAKMMQLDLLESTRRAVDQAIASGQSIGAFRKELGAKLKAAGWWGEQDLIDPNNGELVRAQLGSAHRVNMIYRSNLQSAYSVGRWERIQEDAERAPWLMYDAVDDHRTREQHARLDTTVLPVSDPFWRSFMPPNGYNCRCGVLQLSDSDLDRLGLKPSKRPRVELVDWRNPRTGVVEQIPAAVDPGWNHNPGLDRLGSLKGLAREKVAAYPQEWREPALEALEPVREFFNGDSEEMQWHRAAFDDSPRPIKRLVERARRISVEYEKAGAYARGGEMINMGSKAKRDSPKARGTWRHEFGHILDAQLSGRDPNMYGYLSSGRTWLAAQSADAKVLKDVAGKGRRGAKRDKAIAERAAAYNGAREELIEAGRTGAEALLRTMANDSGVDFDRFVEAMRRETLLLEDLPIAELPIGTRVRLGVMLRAIGRADPEAFVQMGLYIDTNDYRLRKDAYNKAEVLGKLSDLVGSTTKNVVSGHPSGYPGHSVAYYKRSPMMAPTESFANVVALMGHKDDLWHDLARRFAPNQVAVFEDLLNKMESE